MKCTVCPTYQHHYWPVSILKCCYFKIVKPTQKTRKGLSHWLNSSYTFRKGWHFKKESLIQRKKEYFLAGSPWLSLGLRMSSRNTARARNKLFAHAWVRCNSSTPKPETSTLSFPNSSMTFCERQKRKKIKTGRTGEGSGHLSLGEVCLKASEWRQWSTQTSQSFKILTDT